MQNTAAMNSDVKALLTLLALKTGTTSPEIHHALQLAAASRVMMAEEHANPARGHADATASNVAKLRPNGYMPETSASVRRMKQSADAMNSDIKALITLMLLKNGAGANEIQTALRMAAGSLAAAAAEEAEAQRAEQQVDGNPEMVAELANLAGGRHGSRGEKEFAA